MDLDPPNYYLMGYSKFVPGLFTDDTNGCTLSSVFPFSLPFSVSSTCPSSASTSDLITESIDNLSFPERLRRHSKESSWWVNSWSTLKESVWRGKHTHNQMNMTDLMMIEYISFSGNHTLAKSYIWKNRDAVVDIPHSTPTALWFHPHTQSFGRTAFPALSSWLLCSGLPTKTKKNDIW